jgi:hypothetical protein
MSRNSAIAQANRSKSNPLVLGTFSTTSLRYLKGKLGPQNKVIGYKDTNQTSNGGFGGGTYNHWFKINLSSPGWIIIAKGPPRPNYIQVSAYDLDSIPLQGQSIFDADSVSIINNNEVFHPYLGTVMKTQSDLYNQFSIIRLDRGDDRYFPLDAGSYLLCISTTRNEPLDYEVGIVIEFPPTEMYIALEDEDFANYLSQETEIDFNRTLDIFSLVTVDTIISTNPNRPNGFSESLCSIESGATVTVLSGATWLIGTRIPLAEINEYPFLTEAYNEEEYFSTIHDHSLTEWKSAWWAEHQDTDKFPDLFIPLTNRL